MFELTADETEREAFTTLRNDTVLNDFLNDAAKRPLHLLDNSPDTPRTKFIKECLAEKDERIGIQQFITKWNSIKDNVEVQ